MDLKTKISGKVNNKFVIAGEPLSKLVKNASFTEAIFLILQKRLPSSKERQMLDAILVATIDHGIASPSITITRLVASTGTSLQAAVAAGILTIGKYHGGAIEGLAKSLQEEGSRKIPEAKIAEKIATTAKTQGKRLAGYGHKVYKDTDPRSLELIEIAKKLKVAGRAVKIAVEIEKITDKIFGTHLVLNIDGAIAAILSDLEFSWQGMNGVFIIARTPAFVAHAIEQSTEGEIVWRIDESEIEYIGKKLKGGE